MEVVGRRKVADDGGDWETGADAADDSVSVSRRWLRRFGGGIEQIERLEQIEQIERIAGITRIARRARECRQPGEGAATG